MNLFIACFLILKEAFLPKIVPVCAYNNKYFKQILEHGHLVKWQ